ncbi:MULTISPECIES: Ish1 domain-containing protein [Pectobacterium]|uniref:Ish1 domain-containing protein n=1 Tax=Pectobacterium parvum TaxID=2778550 RepID=A0ABW8FZL3_9GAMM|nr:MULTISPECIES: Ish1 domain-containing protein [Pectobacterium]GKW42070.1 hypothetical protein PEC301879_19280 [Pectobacterium carotovorum subsp. carotovorum]
MRGKSYLDAFKIEAIKQIANRDHLISNATTYFDVTIRHPIHDA